MFISLYIFLGLRIIWHYMQYAIHTCYTRDDLLIQASNVNHTFRNEIKLKIPVLFYFLQPVTDDNSYRTHGIACGGRSANMVRATQSRASSHTSLRDFQKLVSCYYNIICIRIRS